LTITRNRRTRVVAGLTAAAVVGSLGVFASSSGTVSAAPGPGGATLSVQSGDESTVFDLGLVDSGNQTCPADAVTGNPGTPLENWRASSFIVDGSVDPAILSYEGNQLGILGAPDGDPSSLPLISGAPLVNSLPAQPNGNINLNDFADITFNNNVGPLLGDGVWNLGIACFDGDVPGLPSERFWSTQIFISNYVASPLSFDWTTETPADAPVLSLGAGTGTEQTINIDNPDASLDSYNLSVVPAPGGAPTVTPGDTSFELTGLVLGDSYDVTLEAVNAAGAVPSATLTFTAAAVTPAPVVTALDVFDGDDVIVAWTEPPGSIPPSSYAVEVINSTGGVEDQESTTGLTATFIDLDLGSYTVEVTPIYPAGSGVTGQTGVDGFSVNPNALIVQEVSVTRPPGALIITQRCGVFNDLDPFTAVDAFPGFPNDLAAETATVDQVGTSPDVDLATAGVQPDPEFDNYPFPTPATYPTECGLDMGTASFVTSGSLAGQFYAADGRLNEVTVLDTRDNDDGWVARGDIEDVFTGDTGNTFSGDYLGWEPVVTDDSDPVGGSAYDQVVTAGPQVLPGTVGGLTGNAELASAPSGGGLGIATLDARMLLLIPASADAADYNATLTLTVA